MKTKWVSFISLCLAIEIVHASSPMVCSPNFGAPVQNGNIMQNGSPYVANGGYASPYDPRYNYQPGNFYGHPQAMPYNGVVPPPQGMMIQQPMNVQPQIAPAPQQPAGNRCTCQKATTGASPQEKIINDRGVIKVYDSSTPEVNSVSSGSSSALSSQVSAKKAGVKVIYDENPNNEIILIRPANMTAEQKSILENQISGSATSDTSTNFNSAMTGMTTFKG